MKKLALASLTCLLLGIQSWLPSIANAQGVVPPEADPNLPAPEDDPGGDAVDLTAGMTPNHQDVLFGVSPDELAKARGSKLPKLSVSVSGFAAGFPIPPKFAYCAPDGKGKIKDGGNMNPAVHWFGAPSGTRSYALIVVDKDVPAKLELANRYDMGIPADYPRQNFYHWVMVDIPASVISVPEGADSKGITPGGKTPGLTHYGTDGENDYAAKAKQGKGGGYDGPCPPWNDMRLHHYHFIVYALNVPTLGLTGSFTGEQAEKAMAGHVLAKGEVVGTFTTSPGVK